MTESLSLQQARKLVLLSQRLPPARQSGSAAAATLAAIEHLGYIQIDTIAVVQRAHHHTLWNRNPRYKTAHLDQLLVAKQIFEYWSHAAAYLPMCDYRYSLVRKQALARGEQKHWYKPDKRLMKAVLQRITTEGPLMAKDFDNTGQMTGYWKSKPAKRALEYLFMQGELMVPGRVNFHKVYDLTERVLPNGVDTSLPTPEEFARFLITQYLRANGLGKASEINYLLKNTKSSVSVALKEMVSNGEVQQIRTGEDDYFVLPNALALLNQPLSRSKLKILSPFDNLLIQRKRMQALFDYNYQIECYVSEAKRQYGYFSLPLLWGGRLAGRMDCKADRKKSVLHIRHLALDPWLTNTDEFSIALCKELKNFTAFNHCDTVSIHKTSPVNITPELEGLFRQ